MPATVLIYTHRSAFSELLRRHLQESERLRPVVVSSDRREARKFLRRSVVDVVLLDPEIPGEDVFRIARGVARRRSPCRAVFFSSVIAEGWVQRAIEARAAGFLSCHAALGDFALAIRAARRGQRFFGTGIATILSELASPRSDVPAFTPRDREILHLLSMGLTTKEIGRKLSLASKTVEEIRYGMMIKTRTTRATQLVRYACEERFVDLVPRWERAFLSHSSEGS
ncbi:MAG TPA: response regulator transcription factor [Planctomycetota bacterium]|nr:response regulator transcription factor [Planctomycetota bacterium]